MNRIPAGKKLPTVTFRIRIGIAMAAILLLTASLLVPPVRAGGRICAWEMALRKLKREVIPAELRYSGMPESVVGACRIGDRTVTALAFDGCGRSLLAAEFGADRRDEPAPGRIVPIEIAAGALSPAAAISGNDDYISAFATPRHGTLVVAGGARWDRTLALLRCDGKSDPLLQRLPGQSAWWRRAVAFSPDGGRLAAQAPDGSDGPVALWRVDADQGRLELADVLPGPSWGVSALEFSPDGHFLVAGLGSNHRAELDGDVLVWDLRSKSPALAHRVAFGGSPNDAESRSGDITALAFAEDGRQLAGGDQDGRIHFWQFAENGELNFIRTVSAHTGSPAAIRSLGTIRNGSLVSAGGDGFVRLWDAQSGALRRSLRLPEPITAAALSPDRINLAAGLANGAIYVLDLQK
jgi:WD40 repeat protein